MSLLEHFVETDRGIEDETWFEVDPAVIYPATLAAIQEELQGDGQVGQHLAPYLNAAREVGEEAWALAGKTLAELSEDERAVRAEVLELARKWFTAELRQSITGGKVGLRILKDEAWRL